MVDTPLAEPAPEPVAAPEPAPAPAEPAPVAADPEPAPTPPEPSTEDVVANALKTFKVGEEGEPEPAKPADPAVKAVIPAAEDPARNPDGTFKTQADPALPAAGAAKPVADPAKPVDPVNFTEAPNRFSPDAKTAWKEAPEAVRAEIHRAVGELETGLDKYREAATEYEPLREYGDMAKQHNTTIKDALDRYTNLERGLNSGNPTASIAEVLSYAGISAVEFAQGVMNAVDGQQRQPVGVEEGQAPGDNPQQAGLIREMRNEIVSMRQQLGNMNSTINEDKRLQTQVQLETELYDFAAVHPRTEELSGEMTKMLSSGYATDLADAYAKADRVIPALGAPQPTPGVVTPAPAVQTDKAALSVTGAPSGGSDPVNRKPPSSAEAAVRDSFAQLGIR